MRVRGLTAAVVLALSTGEFAETAAKPLCADRGIVFKKQRTLELLSQRKVIKTYKLPGWRSGWAQDAVPDVWPSSAMTTSAAGWLFPWS
jgi:hypothetical protein